MATRSEEIGLIEQNQPPSIVIESSQEGEIVPLQKFIEKIDERLNYCQELAEVPNYLLPETIHTWIDKIISRHLYEITKDRFLDRAEQYSEKVEKLLKAEITISYEEAIDLPDTSIVVKNPHEFAVLVSEASKVTGYFANDKERSGAVEHEINHWLPLIESSEANMLFGICVNKSKSGKAEYFPFVSPYGTFTVKAYLSSILGPQKINDLSSGDERSASIIFTAINDSQNKEGLEKKLHKIFNE